MLAKENHRSCGRIRKAEGKKFLTYCKPASLSKATELEYCPLCGGLLALTVTSFRLAVNVSGGLFWFLSC